MKTKTGGSAKVFFFLLFHLMKLSILFFYRTGEETGYFPSMFLHKAGKKERYEAEKTKVEGRKPPPRRYVNRSKCLQLRNIVNSTNQLWV